MDSQGDLTGGGPWVPMASPCDDFVLSLQEMLLSAPRSSTRNAQSPRSVSTGAVPACRGIQWPGWAWLGLAPPGWAWLGLGPPGWAWLGLVGPGSSWLGLDSPGQQEQAICSLERGWDYPKVVGKRWMHPGMKFLLVLHEHRNPRDQGSPWCPSGAGFGMEGPVPSLDLGFSAMSSPSCC